LKNFEDATPNPEFLIKSIAEQGYSLETALADLIDNSIYAKANKIEILVDTDKEPFTLFLADNGSGMDEELLKISMQFPSRSSEDRRELSDLGRFGLGLKTASFSQTRKFTVLSKKKGTKKYFSRKWDVEYLKEQKEWRLLIPSSSEVDKLISEYNILSHDHLNRFEDFDANTIIIWEGLYKFEKYLNETNRKKAIKKQINDVTSGYLSLVFHRFLEQQSNPLKIKINNQLISPFNPFPTKERGFRPIEFKQKNFGKDTIKIEGFVLPARSIGECKKGASFWTMKNKSLMDMEGLYVYRADRIIIYGGWNGLIKKTHKQQLARLKVEVGNKVDHLLHLNVAKSQIAIPHDLEDAFKKYIGELTAEAEREFYNRGIIQFPNNVKLGPVSLFEKKASNKGVLLEINKKFPLLENLIEDLSKEQKSKLNFLLRMINTRINIIRHSHEDKPFVGLEEKDGISNAELISNIKELKKHISVVDIKNKFLPTLGYTVETLPNEVFELLKGE